MSKKTSVVIPCLNEAENLPTAIASAQVSSEVEVIVVDGGSNDGSCQVAEKLGAKVFKTIPSRGRQQQLGVKNASGGLVLFLHADSVLPDGWIDEVNKFASQENFLFGCFKLKLVPVNWKSALVSLGANLRTRLFNLPYGDQSLYFRINELQLLGGVPDKPYLEDLELVLKAKARGQLFVSKQICRSSVRKWEERGYLRTTSKHFVILVKYLLGLK